MINEVIINDSEIAIVLEMTSNIKLMQTIDCSTGNQVYIFSNLTSDDLYLIKKAIQGALDEY